CRPDVPSFQGGHSYRSAYRMRGRRSTDGRPPASRFMPMASWEDTLGRRMWLDAVPKLIEDLDRLLRAADGDEGRTMVTRGCAASIGPCRRRSIASSPTAWPACSSRRARMVTPTCGAKE